MQLSQFPVHAVGVFMNVMVLCSILVRTYKNLGLKDARVNMQKNMTLLNENTTSYSSACELKVLTDEVSSAVTSLSISKCSNDSDVASIQWKLVEPYRETLLYLRIENNDFTYVDIDIFNQFTMLEEIIIRNNINLESISAYPMSEKLKSIIIVNNGEDSRMSIENNSLNSSLSSLVDIQVCNCNLTGGIPLSVFELSTLKTIEFKNNIGNTDLSNVKCSSSIESITLVSTNINGSLSPAVLQYAKYINVSHNNINGTINIVNNSNVQTFIANNNKIENLIVQDNTTITHINMSSQSSNLDASVINAQNLHKMDLSENKFKKLQLKKVNCTNLIVSNVMFLKNLEIKSMAIEGSKYVGINTGENLKNAFAHLAVRSSFFLMLYIIINGECTIKKLTMHGLYQTTNIRHPLHATTFHDIIQKNFLPDEMSIDESSKSKLKRLLGISEDDNDAFMP